MGLPPQQRIRFGSFELDARSGELLRQGVKVDLQDQPFQALMLLLERPGDVVTREELTQRLWPGDTYVDFDRGLNKAINKVRVALKDDAEKPRYIETLPQRGYRFVAQVDIDKTPEPESPAPRPIVAKRSIVPWAVTFCIALLAVGGFVSRRQVPERVADKPFLRVDLDIGPGDFSQPAISPDGMRVVFVSNNALTLRHLDQAGTTRLVGTEGGFFPFFSPNGKSIAFFAAGKLQKMALDGSAPVVLCDARSPGGGTWIEGNHIIAVLDANRQGLSLIPEDGGSPQPLTDSISDPSGPLMHLWPQALPGGNAILFAAVNGSAHGSLRVLTLSNRKVKTVVENSTRGRYLPNGYLVYYSQSKLFGVPLDMDRWNTSGPAVSLVSGVSNVGGGDGGDFDVSNSGTVVYRAGTTGSSFVVSWLSPSGKTEPVLAKPDSFLTPRLSPDGKRLAVAMIEGEEQKLWIYDLARQTWARLTADSSTELLPTWTPDGEFIAFRSGNGLAWTRSDGSGSVARLSGADPNVAPWSFTNDGKWLCFWPLQPESDLWRVPVERTSSEMKLGGAKPLFRRSGSKGAPAVSPDGRWLAYTSNESGKFEIYVMPFAPQNVSVSGKWLISSSGGVSPSWSRNRPELFYQGLDRHIRVVPYKVEGDRFMAGAPQVWSSTLLGATGIFNAFDVAPSGNRAIALLDADEPRPNTLLRILLNVDSELRRTTSARRP